MVADGRNAKQKKCQGSVILSLIETSSRGLFLSARTSLSFHYHPVHPRRPNSQLLPAKVMMPLEIADSRL
jgi:hypothetical protein